MVAYRNRTEVIIMGNKDTDTKGQIQIADEVIASIAGTAALEAEGIGSLTGGNVIMGKLKQKGNQRGVIIAVDGKDVTVDLTVNVIYGCKIQRAASEVQSKVKDAVETMTGLNVCCVNVSVAGIEFEKSNEPGTVEE
jgi:uncharacterized alkaline shock family protein YloU